MHDRVGGASTFVDFLRVARRRKLIILQAVVLVPLVAVIHAVGQPQVYSSSAQVLLSRQNVAATYAGVTDPGATEDPTRYAATQAFLARSPNLAKRVIRTADVPDITPSWFLAHSSVDAAKDADVLRFSVVSSDAGYAQRLADAYASEFTLFRRQIDTAAIRSALGQIQSRLSELKAANELNTAGAQRMIDRQQQLQTLEALERHNAYVARPAAVAHKILPRPKRDALLGLGLGLALGIGLAFLREALDTRIRSAEEISARLELPLLGRLSEPSKELRAENTLVMLERPYSTQAETFRMLRTNLDLTNLDRHARTVMITSGVEGEGKTTTASNLAVALAASGRHVVLIDLDLRRPAVAGYFGLQSRPGLTDVALGSIALDDALVPINVAALQATGSLRVLPSGQTPPNPGEFAGAGAISDILAHVRATSDIVVVDTPPVLHASEAMTLSTQIDAMIVVVRLNLATRGTLADLKQLLDAAPAAKFGFVLTGADPGNGHGYEYGYGYPASIYPYPDKDLVA
jgi:capsular exopolysaccharide synthesis family protein